MKKTTDNLNDNLSSLIRRQNELIDNQNKLLERIAETKTPEREEFAEEFVEDLYRDEVRNGFFVTSHRKKLWNVQIGLINEFARVCKKHNLRWFAYGGTLLGAARHKGYIPWDDDVDLAMFRPDYEKFQKIMMTEIKPPYFVDPWYNYNLEGEQVYDPALPTIKLEYLKVSPHAFPFFPVLKLRDSRTTMLSRLRRENVNDGIWIDIFPFDPTPPFKNKQHHINFLAAREMLFAIVFPDEIKQALEKNEPLVIERKALKRFLTLPRKKKILTWERELLKNFALTEFAGQFRGPCWTEENFTYATKFLDDMIYLPFEKIELPAPKDYDGFLSSQYGDWRKMIVTHTHAMTWSADIPYAEYLRTVQPEE